MDGDEDGDAATLKERERGISTCLVLHTRKALSRLCQNHRRLGLVHTT